MYRYIHERTSGIIFSPYMWLPSEYIIICMYVDLKCHACLLCTYKHTFLCMLMTFRTQRLLKEGKTGSSGAAKVAQMIQSDVEKTTSDTIGVLGFHHLCVYSPRVLYMFCAVCVIAGVDRPHFAGFMNSW